MDLDAYVAEHDGEWRRLELLAKRRRLSAPQVDEMIALYQRTGTHLSVVRSRSPDPALVARLSRIVLTARGSITGSPTFSRRTVAEFFTTTFPLAVYQARRWWLATGAAFVAVAGAIITYIASRPDVQAALISRSDADQLVNSDFASYYSEYPAQDFALQVWTNNALLTGVCLAAGVLIIPVLLVLANNVENIGEVGGIMVGHGRADVFFGLILPHGMLELTAMFVGAGVGLRIGWAWVAPGRDRTRTQALAQTARSGTLVALGLIGVLAVSGIIEAFVTPSPLPTAVRIGLGFLVWLTFIWYVLVLGRRAELSQRTSDVEI